MQTLLVPMHFLTSMPTLQQSSHVQFKNKMNPIEKPRKNLSISMLLVVLACFFLFPIVNAGISLEVLEVSLEMVGEHHVIPYGPLSMFNAYFLDKYNVLLMKRLWSADIEMGYIIENNKLISNHGKDIVKDKTSFDLMLVMLFSCTNNQISLRGGNDGFQKNFDFLDSNIQTKLLAAMFVGSLNGSSIQNQGTKTVLQIQRGNNEPFIVKSSSSVFLDSIKWFLNSTSDMALFENKPNNHSFEDYLEKDAEKFDQYLCSKNILLQGIFSFYLSTPVQMRRFLEKVYALLSIDSNSSPLDIHLFEMCFQPLEKIQSQINAALEFTKAYDKIRKVSFPVSKVNQPQSNHNVPIFKRNAEPSNNFPNGEYGTKTIADCVEVSMLYCVSCLLFNTENHEFSTTHLKPEVRDLKVFFQKYPQVFTINSEIRKDWCAVIADLPEPEIAYGRNADMSDQNSGRNELKPGFVSFLRTICNISGLDSLFEELAHGLLSVQNVANPLQHEEWEKTVIGMKFHLLLRNILKALMGEKRAKNVDIQYSQMTVQPQMMKNEIYGNIHLKFNFSWCKSITVRLSHSLDHAQIYLERDENFGKSELEMKALEESIENSTCWTPVLFIGTKLVEICSKEEKDFDDLEIIEELSRKIHKSISHLYDPSLLEEKVPVLIALKMIIEGGSLTGINYHAMAENIILSGNLTDYHFIKISFVLFSMFRARAELGLLYSGIVNPKNIPDFLISINQSRILDSYLNSYPMQSA
jgi:hypothetical protein